MNNQELKTNAQWSQACSQLHWKEVSGLAVILLIFILFNFLISPGKLPSPDEPGYTDPAASWYFGHGFTSGAWYAQNNQQFFAGNVPLHHITLHYWFKLFGFGIDSSRAHNLFWIALAAVFLWDGLKRTRCFSRFGRLATLSAVLFSESTYFVALDGRPDAITLFLASATFWAILVPSPALRFPVLFLFGMATPWAGLQLVLATGFIFTVYLAILRGSPWREWVVFATGGLVGLATLLVFYDINNVLPGFFASILPHTGNKNFSLYRVTGLWGDRTFIILAFLSVLFLVWSLFSKPRATQALRIALAACIAFFVLPLVLLILGKFPYSYCWMPTWLGVPFLIAWLRLANLKRASVYGFSGLLACAVVLGGYPRILIARTFTGNDGPVLNPVKELVMHHLKKGEVAIYSFPAFYAVKPLAGEAYYVNWYLKPMTPENRKSAAIAIIDPSLISWVEEATEVRWKPASEVVTLSIPRFLRSDLPYPIQVFRRSGEAIPKNSE